MKEYNYWRENSGRENSHLQKRKNYLTATMEREREGEIEKRREEKREREKERDRIVSPPQTESPVEATQLVQFGRFDHSSMQNYSGVDLPQRSMILAQRNNNKCSGGGQMQ